MGMRIRLKASFDISGFSSTNQIILKAMKQYGMILADNGSNLFFQGTPDARWNDNDLNALKAVPASAFDVVQMAPVYDSTTAPTGAAPVINSFTASSTSVASGTAVTLTPTVTGASYSYIDKAGFIRGPVVVNPTATTTYTLTSRNAYGTTSASVTVTVQAGTAPTLQFAAIPTQTFGAAAFAVSATSNSTGAITYSVVSGPATVSGSTVTYRRWNGDAAGESGRGGQLHRRHSSDQLYGQSREPDAGVCFCSDPDVWRGAFRRSRRRRSRPAVSLTPSSADRLRFWATR